MRQLGRWLNQRIISWLTKECQPAVMPLCDFKRLSHELKSGDVILVEGRTRASEVIKIITQSAWTHSILYIGRLYDIEDKKLRDRVRKFYTGNPDEQLIIEAELGLGTIVAPLNKYKDDHLRICRPTGLSPADAQRVVAYCIRHLGADYDVRQLLDLARFFFPWAIMPRRWRSSLFQHNAGASTRTVCSHVIAQAFSSVDFPILPFIDRGDDGSLRFFKRNPKLFTPKDFDYSPYFEVIKYPFLGLDDVGVYRKLPWSREGVICNDEKQCFVPDEAGDGGERGESFTTADASRDEDPSVVPFHKKEG